MTTFQQPTADKATEGEQEKLLTKLRQILAMTKSPNENEAAVAASMLQKFLTDYNMEIADLEDKGQAKSKVGKNDFDLGKAVYIWTWKIQLAEGLARHFYCVALNQYGTNNLSFVGRPENVEALKMLFNWLIDQIKRLATAERKARPSAANIHPMRWQMSFGEGVVPRLMERLQELREEQAASYEGTQELVLHHDAELSDWLEANGKRRIDGQKTKSQIENEARWEAYNKEKADLLESDPVAYYKKFPNETPEAKAAAEKRFQTRLKRSAAARNSAWNRGTSWKTSMMESDKDTAYTAGRNSADKVNLQPFLNKGDKQEQI